MIKSNNSYLYNFILCSSLCDYDESFHPTLGLNSSLPMYLFKYSKDLFFSYPYIFRDFSLVSDSNTFFNICCSLFQNIDCMKNIDYSDKKLTSLFLDRFNFDIYNYQSKYYIELYQNNDIKSILYNGLKFNILPVEPIIAYNIQQYYINNKSLDYIKNIVVLSCIYKTQLMYNNILSNLLLLKLNIKLVIKQLIRDLCKINMFEIPHFAFTDKIAKDRTLEVLEFLYG